MAQTIETEEMVLHDEQARTAEIHEQIDVLRSRLDERVRELEASQKRQAVYSQSILFHQDLLKLAQDSLLDSPTPEETVKDQSEAKAKPARIGKLHYRLLCAIRSNETLSLSELVTESGVPVRRTKLQMADDVERGIIKTSADLYELTSEGARHLRRFEDYRRLKGIPLPLLDTSKGEDDQGEADSETQAEEGEA